jgi:hypothetical protein
VRPALSETDYFDPDGLDHGVGFYYFVGVQGRAVGSAHPTTSVSPRLLLPGEWDIIKGERKVGNNPLCWFPEEPECCETLSDRLL